MAETISMATPAKVNQTLKQIVNPGLSLPFFVDAVFLYMLEVLDSICFTIEDIGVHSHSRALHNQLHKALPK
jgi:hypothetical protein